MHDLAQIVHARTSAVDWSGCAIAAVPVRDLALFHVRIGRNGAAAVAALGLPDATRATDDAIWIGPSEWLVTCPRAEATETSIRIEAALDGGAGWMAEISDRIVALDVADALTWSHLTGLSVGALSEGRTARTRLGDVAITLVGLAGGSTRLLIDRSYEQYLRGWLDRAI
jgi:heterotetrameric sarcosine oxidase gamma subunit